VKIRRAYQRSVVVPMIGVEQLWRDYDIWENQLNKTLAKSLLADFQPRYLQAKVVARLDIAIHSLLSNQLFIILLFFTDFFDILCIVSANDCVQVFKSM
jgi:hypothetical protein